MAYCFRLLWLGCLTALGIGLSACSTVDLRGRTQSVAIDRYDNQQPTYAGRQGLVRPATRPPYYRRAPATRNRPSMAQARPRARDDAARQGTPGGAGRRYTNDRRAIAAPHRQTYALPPRVERRALPNLERRSRGATRAKPVRPAQDPVYERTGWARWIGRSWLGHKTASGEMFDAGRLTGAHASLPLPSFVYVTNRLNGRTILIRVNDRVPAHKGRAIVVSQRAADLLDFRGAGRVKVDLQYGGPASPVANERHEYAFLKQQPWYRKKSAAARTAGAAPVVQSRPIRRYPKPTYPRWDNTRR